MSVQTRGGLILPSSYYIKSATAVNKAVNEYDERLSFGWNEENQDWCVFIELPRGDKTFEGSRKPILGFGSQIPTPEEAVKRIYTTDAKRHGDFIWNEMQKENRRLQRESQYKTDQATEEAAEKIDFVNRKGRVIDETTFPMMNRAQRRRFKM